LNWKRLPSRRTPSSANSAPRNQRFNIPEEPLELLADQGKLEQVLANLISNAVKFSSGNSGIRISGHSRSGQFKISVEDQGIGMTQEQVTRVFYKCYRVDASDSAQEGLGLGMAIAKSIIEAHEGEIWVASKPGRGTTVSFALPLNGTGIND
jgi:signal transduction histidine kinase